jgi:hypothetical protein
MEATLSGPAKTRARPAKKAKKHLSVSQLEMLSKCGQQYAYRYLDELKIPPGVQQIRGTAVHASTEANWREKQETYRDLPVEDLKDIAAARFDLEISGGFAMTSDEESVGRDKVLGEAKDTAVAMAAFFGQEIAQDYQPVLVEQSFRIELPGEYDFVGVIDLADDQRRIVDLKTSMKAKNPIDAEASLQLTSYVAGHGILTGELATSVRLDTIVKNKSGIRRQILESQRSERDFEVLAARINAAESVIAAGAFAPAPMGAWWCGERWCGYWHQCPFVNAERRAAAAASDE